MRTINDQLAEIVSGKKTPEEILSEGVGVYAIKYFSPAVSATASPEEAMAFAALRDAYEDLKEKVESFMPRAPKFKPSAIAEELVQCKCGHSVPRYLVMVASLGTCCPDCYDRMS